MAKTNAERLGILEERTENIAETVGRIEKKIDGLDKKYVTRAEALAVSAVLTILIAAVALFLN